MNKLYDKFKLKVLKAKRRSAKQYVKALKTSNYRLWKKTEGKRVTQEVKIEYKRTHRSNRWLRGSIKSGLSEVWQTRSSILYNLEDIIIEPLSLSDCGQYITFELKGIRSEHNDVTSAININTENYMGKNVFC